MESDRVHARAAIMRAAVDREDAPGAERGWLQLAESTAASRRSPTSTRARWCATSATAGAMRGGVFPARITESQARELIARRAADDRP